MEKKEVGGPTSFFSVRSGNRVSVAENMEKRFGPLAEELGYELVYAEYAKEGQDWYLRFFIDHPQGIDINDCEKVSRAVEAVLDQEELIKGQYILEVSSLGLERPLRTEKDYQEAIGEYVEICLYHPEEKKKKFRGRLLSYGEEIRLECDGKEVSIKAANISKANRSVEF